METAHSHLARSGHAALFQARSALFAPASRPELFAKAAASGAHLVCLDLEDAVGISEKGAARTNAAAALLDFPRFVVRINSIRTREGMTDLVSIAGWKQPPAMVILPKVRAAAELEIAASVLEGCVDAFAPMIECAHALARIDDIASSPACAAVLLGAEDLAAELNVARDAKVLDMARGMVVAACVRARKPAIDSPYLGLHDEDGLCAAIAYARREGFAGKLAIHPRHVAAINGAWEVSAAQLAEARGMLTAFGRSEGAAANHGGAMIDAATVRRAVRLMERASDGH